VVVISSGDETLRTLALGALVDVMHEARLLRLRARKAHLEAAFHAPRVYLALWHRPPISGLARLASYGSTVGKLSQPTRICPSHAEGVSHDALDDPSACMST
jgi:hypothetical protein